MDSFSMSKIERQFEEYKKVIGTDLLGVAIVKREGTIMKDLRTSNIDSTNIFNEILSRIMDRFPMGSFSAGIYETEHEVCLLFEIISSTFFIAILAKTINIDMIFPYSYITAEKISMILEGKPTSPSIPKLFFQNVIRTDYISRKIEAVQKIKAKLGESAYKLILAGDKGVKKVIISQDFVENTFAKDYASTIGTSIYKMAQDFKSLSVTARFVMWDLAEPGQFKKVRQSYLSNADAGILVYDTANRDSFERVKKYHEDVVKASPEISLVLIGYVSDAQRQVSLLEGETFAERLGFLLHTESSPENRDIIQEVVRLLALQLILKSLVVVDIETIDNIKLLVNDENNQEEISIEFSQEESNPMIESDNHIFQDLAGRKILKAYNGIEPFIFISYSHEDSAIVYREIEWLHNKGFNIWYDEGIPLATQWTKILPQKINTSKLFIIFLSVNSIRSRNVSREVNYAIKHDKTILPIYLEKISLPEEYDFTLGPIQGVMKHELEESRYQSKLIETLRDIFK